MIDISVILPTYDERENIPILIDRIRKNLISHNFEIIVVDDDSPDETWKVVQGIAEKDASVRVIRRQGERGLTSAIAKGIEAAKGGIVLWMDCDLSMPPDKIPSLLGKINEGYDIAAGSRYIPGGGMVIIESSQDSYISAILSFVMNVSIQKLLDPSFKDYTSGFVAVKKEVFEDIKLRGDYGEYFIDFIYTAIKKGYKVTEIPYICEARKYGVSKTGASLPDYLLRGWKYIWTAVRVKFTRIKANAKDLG